MIGSYLKAKIRAALRRSKTTIDPETRSLILAALAGKIKDHYSELLIVRDGLRESLWTSEFDSYRLAQERERLRYTLGKIEAQIADFDRCAA